MDAETDPTGFFTKSSQPEQKRQSGIDRVSLVEKNVIYTPFHAHASLERARSDDPWRVKTPGRNSSLALPAHEPISEETTPSDSGSVPSSRRQEQAHLSGNQPIRPDVSQPEAASKPKDVVAIPQKRPTTNCCQTNMVFFISPLGILMISEIGLCAIAFVCGDFSSVLQEKWKLWYTLWTVVLIATTGAFFLLHLCGFIERSKLGMMIFLLIEIIYDALASLSLLLSAVAYLRESVDPSTNRSYSLSMVLIGGVCGIIASVLYGISAFLAFQLRQRYKHSRQDPLDDDQRSVSDTEAIPAKKQVASGPAKRIIIEQPDKPSSHPKTKTKAEDNRGPQRNEKPSRHEAKPGTTWRNQKQRQKPPTASTNRPKQTVQSSPTGTRPAQSQRALNFRPKQTTV